MSFYLFLARSITRAQEMAKVLEQAGIYTKVRRAGSDMTERGCGYSLEISQTRFLQALDALKESGKRPVKVFLVSGGKRQEVAV